MDSIEYLIKNCTLICDKLGDQRGRHHRCYDSACLLCEIYNGTKDAVKDREVRPGENVIVNEG